MRVRAVAGDVQTMVSGTVVGCASYTKSKDLTDAIVVIV